MEDIIYSIFFIIISKLNEHHDYLFVYPIDHKKIKNMIVIIKVIRKQLEKIIKELYSNMESIKLINTQYQKMNS